LAELRGLPAEHGLKATLDQVLDATRELFAAGGAGLMMVDPDSVLSGVAATDEAGHILEQTQEQIGEGPCVDTLTFDRVISTADLAEDQRWQGLTSRMPESPIRALIGVPVRIGGGAVGALNVYRNEPGEWTDGERSALEAYARLVEQVLSTGLEARRREQLAEQLQQALDNRVTIDRAVGAVMAREQVNAVMAFNKLRFKARSASRKVVDVAAELLDELSGGG
jgi:GAF domain-containing protein